MRSLAPSLALLCFVAVACGGSSEPAKPASQPAPHPAPTFTLTPPGEQLSPELNKLIAELKASNPNLAEVSAQIASHKHAGATGRAGRKLISLAEKVGSPSWTRAKRPDVVETNAQRGRVASELDLQAQLENLQTEALTPIYQAMQNLGGEAVLQHAMGVVKNVGAPVERRALALGVLSMKLPSGDPRSAEVARYSEEIDKKMAALRSTPAAMQEAKDTIRKLADPFQKCYQPELEKKPDLEVRGKLILSIGTDGKVTAAKGRNIAPASLAACVERAGRAATFSPRAKATDLTVPVVFEKQ